MRQIIIQEAQKNYKIKFNELKAKINEEYDQLLEEHESIKEDEDPNDWNIRKETLQSKRESKITILKNIFGEAIKTARSNKNKFIDYVEEKGTPEQKIQL